jgi:FeS assembly SUF system protein
MAHPLEAAVIAEIKTVFDPEIPVDLYALGLIYSLDFDEDLALTITMTLTTPNCPEAGVLPGRVVEAAMRVPGLRAASINLVWEPVWNREMMSEAAKLQLGLF